MCADIVAHVKFVFKEGKLFISHFLALASLAACFIAGDDRSREVEASNALTSVVSARTNADWEALAARVVGVRKALGNLLVDDHLNPEETAHRRASREVAKRRQVA